MLFYAYKPLFYESTLGVIYVSIERFIVLEHTNQMNIQTYINIKFNTCWVKITRIYVHQSQQTNNIKMLLFSRFWIKKDLEYFPTFPAKRKQ